MIIPVYLFLADMPEMNEEYIDNREIQFTNPWMLRQFSGIAPVPDGPDPFIIST